MGSTLDFNLRLKNKRSDLGFSQKDLAKKIGVSVTTIQKYESGNTAPKGPHLVSLANILGCSIDFLMTGSTCSSVLNSNLLKDIITGVEQWLSARELELDPASKGELVTLLYEQFLSEDSSFNEGTLDRFMRLGTK